MDKKFEYYTDYAIWHEFARRFGNDFKPAKNKSTFDNDSTITLPDGTILATVFNSKGRAIGNTYQDPSSNDFFLEKILENIDNGDDLTHIINQLTGLYIERMHDD